MMSPAQAIGVTLGYKIGTTVDVQLIAFNLADTRWLSWRSASAADRLQRRGTQQTGSIILGFGFTFFGLGVMGTRCARCVRSRPSPNC